jgi:hypothetical protein
MDEAIKIVCDKHFHQSFWLPSTSQHDRLRVTYATTTNFEDESLPVILFCGPMFGSRWNAQDFDYFIRKHGVRIIFVDRPGMGGSTLVPLPLRIPVWIETVPVLLKRLGIERVHLLSHSAGTMYLLNTLYHHRSILYPRPYVALISPWVHNSHSSAMLMTMASKIPSNVIDHFSALNKFIIGRVAPVTSWSGGVFSSIGNLFQTSPAASTESDENADMTPAEKYGVPEDVAKYLSDLRMKYCLAESWVSGDQDAQLCLKKAGYGNWGICEDYEDFVRKLVELEKPYLTAADAGLKLKVQVYFAESDISEFTLYNQSHFRDSPTDDSRSDWRLWQRGNQVFREVLGSGRRERCDRI